MPYITQADLLSEISPEFLIEALDDDRDRIADAGVWDALEASVAAELNGLLSHAGVSLPLSEPYPDAVLTASRYGCLEKLWMRRGLTSDRHNPYAARARQSREALAKWAQEYIATSHEAAWGSDTKLEL